MQKVAFNEVVSEYPDLLVIAGEYSGDEHAARFVRHLQQENPQCSICAIGGENLEKTGVDFLFNLVDFSVVGLTEVLRNLQLFSKLIRMTCDWIERYQPKAVCFVDFPGLNLRIAKELYRRGVSHKAGGKVKLYHYISPQIWAWRAKRRFTIARYLDSLGTIFPFEKSCYQDTDLDVQFLGHPFMDDEYELPVVYDCNGPVLLLPGSREHAVKKNFSVMLDTAKQLKKNGEMREFVVVYPDDEILTILQKISQKYKNLSLSFIRSGSCLVRTCGALMSPGTMALNCALAGIPSVVMFKASTMTYGVAKLVLKVKYLHIANILLKRESAREFLQFAAKPKLIAQALKNCINDPSLREQAEHDAEELRRLLSGDAQMNVESWIQGALA